MAVDIFLSRNMIFLHTLGHRRPRESRGAFNYTLTTLWKRRGQRLPLARHPHPSPHPHPVNPPQNETTTTTIINRRPLPGGAPQTSSHPPSCPPLHTHPTQGTTGEEGSDPVLTQLRIAHALVPCGFQLVLPPACARSSQPFASSLTWGIQPPSS